MISIEELAAFCKKKGFVFRNSEIYNGLAGFFDFGPLGVELKNNVKQLLWRDFVQTREDVYGIDGAIIAHPKVWKASGHVDSFSDVLLDCEKCKARYRGDTLIEDELGMDVDGIPEDKINEKFSLLSCFERTDTEHVTTAMRVDISQIFTVS